MINNLSRRSLFLYIADLLLIAGAFILTFGGLRAGVPLFGQSFIFLIDALIVFPLCIYIFDLYYPYKLFKIKEIVPESLLAVLLAFILLSGMSYLDRSVTIRRIPFVQIHLLIFFGVCLNRFLYDLLFQSRFLDKRTLIVGSGAIAQGMVSRIQKTPHSGMDLIGVCSETAEEGECFKLPILGNVSKLSSLIEWQKVQVVIMALDQDQLHLEKDVFASLWSKPVQIVSAVYLMERLSGKIPEELMQGDFILSLASQMPHRPYMRLKRVLDVATALMILLLIWPIFGLIAILVAISKDGPIFFMQKRIGQKGQKFTLYKFRSMTGISQKTKEVTPLGYWLRKYRLDELPQLWNVIKGDMSLVGPRPEMSYFVTRYRKKNAYYDTLLTLKPGLTGWAQVNHSHVSSLKDYDEKFRYNLYYLKNISLFLDFEILLKTIRIVVLGRGK